MQKKNNLNKTENIDDKNTDNEEDEDAHALLNRTEDKYFLSRKYLEDVVSELSDRLALGDIDTDTRYCHNRTIYLDDKDLSSFRDGISKKLPRMKVRIRQYSPNGLGWEKVAYAEFKIKDEDSESKKIRVRIPAEKIDELCNGGKIVIDENLININRDLERRVLENRVNAINGNIARKGLRKQIEIRYERRAYTGKEIRITIDDNLQFFDATPIDENVKKCIIEDHDWYDFLQPYLLASWDDPLILEVKLGEDTPNWVKNLLKRVDAQKQSFSKYCAGIISQMKTSASQGKLLSLSEDSSFPLRKHDIIRDLIKNEENLYKKHAKAVVLPNEILDNYLEDNEDLRKAINSFLSEGKICK